MQYRPGDVAAHCGVGLDAVAAVTIDQVQAALDSTIDPVVLEVATQEPAAYWRVGDRFFLDDPAFGGVSEFSDLVYDSDLGLTNKRWWNDKGAD